MILKIVAGTVATAYILTIILMATVRISYPFELEWMEGGTVDHILQILAGKPLYVAPSFDFTPYIYPPLYYYLSALFSGLIGVGFVAPRLISFLATLGCLGIIFSLVRKETGKFIAGLIAAGLFAATFRIGGAWFDIARVDMLYLLFLLGAVQITMNHQSRRSAIGSAVLLSLAYLTKQSALAIIVPLVVYNIFYNKAYRVSFIATLALLVGGLTLLLNIIHNGWFSYYLFAIPGSHAIYNIRFITFWTRDILAPLPVASLMALTFVVWRFITQRNRKTILWIVVIVALVGSSLLGRVHSAGYNNVLIPAYATLAILFGIGIESVASFTKRWSGGAQSIVQAVIYLSCVIQFSLLWYNPIAQLPTDEDERAGHQLIGQIAAIDGPVFLPFHGYYAHMAGKKSMAHQMAVHDVLRSQDSRQSEALMDDLRARIAGGEFRAIIVDRGWNDRIVKQEYSVTDTIFDDSTVFYPVTGFRIRPETMLKPKTK